jgi:CheY-like chemotaxis protein
VKAILVVDNDPDVRLACRDRLERWGYVVHSAASGEQALTLLSTQEIHAMLLDLHLPGLEGAEVLRLIRAQGLTLPILLISASHSGQVDELLTVRGAQGFLAKPFANESSIGG